MFKNSAYYIIYIKGGGIAKKSLGGGGRAGRGRLKGGFWGGIVKIKTARIDRRGDYCQNGNGENMQNEESGEKNCCGLRKSVLYYNRLV